MYLILDSRQIYREAHFVSHSRRYNRRRRCLVSIDITTLSMATAQHICIIQYITTLSMATAQHICIVQHICFGENYKKVCASITSEKTKRKCHTYHQLLITLPHLFPMRVRQRVQCLPYQRIRRSRPRARSHRHRRNPQRRHLPL